MEQRVFLSGANRVSLHSAGSTLWVEKKYGSQLTGYPVIWPVSRCETEASLLEYLSQRFGSPEIRFPRVYSCDPSGLLKMEYCPGKPLAVCREAELDRPELWKALFRLLYGLSGISRGTAAAIIGPALARQSAIRDCMLREKIKDAAALDGFAKDMPDALCLGDLSLNNILLDGGHLWILDLECAHWGKQGYDAGQLLAMSRACWPDGSIYDSIKDAFVQSIPDARYRASARLWEERFLPFYQNKG